MEGYDIALIGNFYAFPPFNEMYGQLQPDGDYQVPAQWQAGISNGAQCGQIVGLLRESHARGSRSNQPLMTLKLLATEWNASGFDDSSSAS